MYYKGKIIEYIENYELTQAEAFLVLRMVAAESIDADGHIDCNVYELDDDVFIKAFDGAGVMVEMALEQVKHYFMDLDDEDIEKYITGEVDDSDGATDPDEVIECIVEGKFELFFSALVEANIAATINKYDISRARFEAVVADLQYAASHIKQGKYLWDYVEEMLKKIGCPHA